MTPLLGRIYERKDVGSSAGYFMVVAKDANIVTVSPLFWLRGGRVQTFTHDRSFFSSFYARFDEAKTSHFPPFLQGRYDQAKYRRWRWIELQDR